MTEKRYTYLNASRNKYIGSFFCNDIPLTNPEVFDLLNENELLKKQIEEYTNPDKYILIKKTESSTEEYNSCPDCQHYEREYEEVIAFGEYETLTKEICNAGHDIEDTDANKCNDYEYNEF